MQKFNLLLSASCQRKTLPMTDQYKIILVLRIATNIFAWPSCEWSFWSNFSILLKHWCDTGMKSDWIRQGKISQTLFNSHMRKKTKRMIFLSYLNASIHWACSLWRISAATWETCWWKLAFCLINWLVTVQLFKNKGLLIICYVFLTISWLLWCYQMISVQFVKFQYACPQIRIVSWNIAEIDTIFFKSSRNDISKQKS